MVCGIRSDGLRLIERPTRVEAGNRRQQKRVWRAGVRVKWLSRVGCCASQNSCPNGGSSTKPKSVAPNFAFAATQFNHSRQLQKLCKFIAELSRRDAIWRADVQFGVGMHTIHFSQAFLVLKCSQKPIEIVPPHYHTLFQPRGSCPFVRWEGS